MSLCKVDKKSGCKIMYNKAPLRLANNDMVFFEIEGIEIPKGADNNDVVEFLKQFENELNTEVIKIKGQSARGLFPHFYIRCPYSEQTDIIVSTFSMAYVDTLKIVVQPSIGKVSFKGSKEEYLQYKIKRNENVLVVNAKDSTHKESMIQYWIDKTHYNFAHNPYICPATGESLDIEELDCAHVEIVGHPKMGQFITLEQRAFKESLSRRPFYIKPEYLVETPNPWITKN